MNVQESIPEIIKKFKNEHNLKSKTADRVLDLIGEALKQIESAKTTMEEDAELDKIGLGKTPYGFTLNRFGEKKIHPGIDIIQKAENSIRSNLRQLGIQIEKGEEKKKESGLRAMMTKAK